MPTAGEIFRYTDYRILLKDYFDSAKEKNPKWSYGLWAKKLRLKSPSTLIMIVNGDRNPSGDLVKKLSLQLGLNDREQEFFEDLVRLRKAEKDPTRVVEILEKLKKQHPTGTIKLLDDKSFSAIANWYFYAIRELVQLADFKEEANWIVRRLKFDVTPGQVREAISILLDLGLLTRNSEGKLIQAVSRIDTQSDIASEALKRFHEQILAHAQKSIRNTDILLREISGITFPIKIANLPRAKKLIREFQNELCQLLAESDADEIYQFEVSFFPMTNKRGTKHEAM